MSPLALLLNPAGDRMVRPHPQAGTPPRSGTVRRMVTETLLFTVGVLAYFGVRGLTESDVGTAREHAADIVGLERALGLFFEPSAQDAVAGHQWLVTLANWVYIWGHWPVIIGTALWLAVRHPNGYRFLRN